MTINELKEWFGLNPVERRGSFIFILGLFVVGVGFSITSLYHTDPSQVRLSKTQIQHIDSIINAQTVMDQESAVQTRTLRLKSYDPNTITSEELIEMGIPKRTATIWINYIAKGGRFYKPEDINNIYSLENDIYEALLPYTQVAGPKRKPRNYAPRVPKKTYQRPKELFTFDPNTISKDSVYNLNIPAQLAASILGYRKAGGIFRTVEKLKDSPGINDSIYAEIAPYIQIDSIYQINKKDKLKTFVATKKPIASINLNSADSIELRQIRGIGAFRAKILIERREQIGGYYSLDQLYDDLYSIDSADVQQIKPYLYVDESYKRIDLQSIEIWKLQRHHYFDKNMATTAVNYFKHRDQRTKLDDFIDSSPLSREKWEKVKPYLTLDE